MYGCIIGTNAMLYSTDAWPLGTQQAIKLFATEMDFLWDDN